RPSFLCERLFLTAPEDDAESVSGAAEMVSLESQKPVAEFDILAFSISFENDYPNILKIMAQAGIPLLAAERSERHPLIIGGGIAPTLNPEPLADFFDLFILGESELVLPEFTSVFEEARCKKISRKQFLFDFQKNIKAVYVPSLYNVNYSNDGKIESVKPVAKQLPDKIEINADVDINSFNTQEIISAPRAEMEEMFLVELNRGCAHYCRFCAAAYVYHPARFRKWEEIKKSIKNGLTQKRKIGLVGTAACEHPELIKILKYIKDNEAQAGISSLRIDSISEEIVSLLKEAGIETIALAPEAGSQKMRDMLRKGIKESDIIRAAEILIGNGINKIRLYFMVGLPGETEHDIDSIIELTKKIQHTALKYTQGKKKFRNITLSINQFIPKAHTPLQWCPLANTEDAAKKIKKIVKAFRQDKQVRVIHDVPKWNYVQALLSLGDRRVGKILLAVQKNNGNWKKALKEVNINPEYYVYRQKSLEEILPWDIFEMGLGKKALAADFKKVFRDDGCQ
ncbi:MAG: radical SAM protein, partial [Syntrophaceae bacterium]|nr:radical SAM protein [Syntrophaceae bacterium]